MGTLNVTYGSGVTLDETIGLQNLFATPAPAGDADDNDILAGALPLAFRNRLTAESAPVTPINAALSGYNGTNSGSNAFTFAVPNATGMGFTDSLGNALDGDASGLFRTADNAAITLWTDEVDNNIVYGKANGVIVFAAYLEETGIPVSGAKIWMVQYEAIRHPTTDPDESVNLLGNVFVTVDKQVEFSLANAPSGQNLFLTLGDATAAIVVTGARPANQSTGASITTGDTVNTSQGGGSTTIGNKNQMVDPGEGMIFTFVTGANPGLTIPNLSHGEAVLESNIQFTGMLDAQAASLEIVQMQQGKVGTIQLIAYSTGVHSGNDYIDHLTSNVAVPIDNVVVRNKAGTIIENSDGSVNTAGLAITFSGGVATVTGVRAGYTIDYHTMGEHNRVQANNVGTGATGASFDIGGFTLLQVASDTAEVGSRMRFEDAGPRIGATVALDATILNTQDAQTIGAATDSDTQAFASAFQFAGGYDSDGAGTTTLTYALAVSAAGVNSGLKSGGADIYLHAIGGKVVGSTSAVAAAVLPSNTVFDLATTAGAAVTLQQYSRIDHALPGVGSDFAAQEAILANGLVSLEATAQITDRDGDVATSIASLDLGGNVRFDDDGPHAFVPAPIALVNSGSAEASAAMNAAASTGADVLGIARFIDIVAADDYLYAVGGTSPLTSGGENIVLSGYGTTLLTASTASGGTVFTASLDNVTDQYTIRFARAIDDGSGVSFLGAAPVKSGNPTYNLIDDVGSSTLDLLFSGGDTAHGVPTAHSVNVSTNGAGVDNQSMNASGTLGETLRIDFATGAALSGSPEGSDFNQGTHQTVNGYSFLLTQNTPSGTTATTYLQVFDADDDKVLVNDAGDVPDTITRVSVDGVTIYDGTFHSATINGSLVSGMLYNGGIVLTGLSEGATGDGTGGDDPLIKVSTATGFNRVEVSNFAGQTVDGVLLGGNGFDLAPAGVDQAIAGTAFAFALPIQVTDYDQDFGPVETIAVSVTPLPLG
ncbi:DUF5801 repeats-in-toxin domain-containing protein [Pseudoduganella umbonata]|uniref:DUF5801 domain-containing protein n=1 Tax=Pseudoduganella umbonata TaxID=864828 RepID=A0A4P8HJD6_9BURK|nr:DUF5801 repeats-in-toxin domain-containing protein [Pseudoduganella umbonata]MBB3219639.1 hypothetical protein [Pseudoduganella umbonata]QCP09703.1 hypothetical protein FCL38_04145 [Pseudoduganella umbonata]